MTRFDTIIRALCAFWMVAAMALCLDDARHKDQLAALHPRFVMNCVMGTDELPEECEKRWQGALGK